jgi:hypothetical protein
MKDMGMAVPVRKQFVFRIPGVGDRESIGVT